MDKREEEKLVLAGDGYSRVVGRVYCAIATERGIERDTEKSRTRHDKKKHGRRTPPGSRQHPFRVSGHRCAVYHRFTSPPTVAYFFLLLLFISLSWKKKIVLIEIFFLQLHPPKTRSKLNLVKILKKRG
jgi:hypothetical protein